MLLAFAPYIIIVVILGAMSLTSVLTWLDGGTTEFSWPGLHVIGASGKTPTSETFKLNWFAAAGSGLLLSGILTALVLRVNPLRALRIYGKTIAQIKWALVTVMSVLATSAPPRSAWPGAADLPRYPERGREVSRGSRRPRG